MLFRQTKPYKLSLWQPLLQWRVPMLVSSLFLYSSTTVVNLGNYLFNLILGYWLGPARFADVNLLVTLLLVASFITSAMSTTTAKFAATYVAAEQAERLTALHAWLRTHAYRAGIVLALLLLCSAPWLVSLFHMHSVWSFVLLGVSFPLFFPLAIDRGMLQGKANFVKLAMSQQAEMWVRLGAAIGFVALGLAVNGAAAALPLSIFAAWVVTRSGKPHQSEKKIALSQEEKRAIITYLLPVAIGLMGQIIINNSDVLLVKVFFPTYRAGLYAALALIGRIVFFSTWSIVLIIFPLVAQRQQKGLPHRFLLWLALGTVLVVSGAIIAITFWQPGEVITLLFGKKYLAIAPLLWLYALATAFYTLANVIVSYNLSLGKGKGNYLVLLAGLVQVGMLLAWHSNLWIVVMIQVYVMAGLLLLLLVNEIKHMVVKN